MGWEEGNKKRSLFEAEVRLGRAHEYYTSVISNPEKPSGPLKRSAQMHLKTAAEWFRYDVARALEQTK